MKYVMGKRERMLELLSSNPDITYTLEEICSSILCDGKGKSTVYRIASELVAEGCLRRISDGKTRHCVYQYVGGEHCHNHLHLKCKGCGRLIHMDEEISNELESRVKSIGFVIEEGTLLYGTCAGCMEGGLR